MIFLNYRCFYGYIKCIMATRGFCSCYPFWHKAWNNQWIGKSLKKEFGSIVFSLWWRNNPSIRYCIIIYKANYRNN